MEKVRVVGACNSFLEILRGEKKNKNWVRFLGSWQRDPLMRRGQLAKRWMKISKTRIDGRWMDGFKSTSSSTDDGLFFYHPGNSKCGSLWAPKRRVRRTHGRSDGRSFPSSSLHSAVTKE